MNVPAILVRLARAGWKVSMSSEFEPPVVHPSAREVMTPAALDRPKVKHKIVAARAVPGGCVTIEVEAVNEDVATMDLVKLCDAVVVTE